MFLKCDFAGVAGAKYRNKEMRHVIRNRWIVSEEYRKLSISILQENLASLRAKIGITQEEIANIIGVTRQTYYAIETKKRAMTWNTYLSLIFLFDAVSDTKEMIRELSIYPIDLVMRFNNKTIGD